VEPGNLLFILSDEHGAILAPGDFSYPSAPGEKPVLVVERKER
jgi:hypothetical protein